jgi:hypothetical protein
MKIGLVSSHVKAYASHHFIEHIALCRQLIMQKDTATFTKKGYCHIHKESTVILPTQTGTFSAEKIADKM